MIRTGGAERVGQIEVRFAQMLGLLLVAGLSVGASIQAATADTTHIEAGT